jgi:hypothetical protein
VLAVTALAVTPALVSKFLEEFFEVLELQTGHHRLLFFALAFLKLRRRAFRCALVGYRLSYAVRRGMPTA